MAQSEFAPQTGRASKAAGQDCAGTRSVQACPLAVGLLQYNAKGICNKKQVTKYYEVNILSVLKNFEAGDLNEDCKSFTL